MDDSNCSNGDVRLVNGSSVLEGRVEICINRVWGTVCSEAFTVDEARVTCHSLGMISGDLLLRAKCVSNFYFNLYCSG